MDLAPRIVQAYSEQSMNSARSQQSVQRILGPSDLGGCRSYIAHMLKDSPRNDRQTPPWAAFIGTWVGEGLERAYVALRPTALRQVKIEVDLPSGYRHTEGTADVVDPDEDAVIDFKSLNGNESMVDGEPPFKNIAQIMIYLLGAIQMGLLTKDATWHLIYVDRSGDQPVPVDLWGTLDMSVIEEAEERVSEAEYAAIHQEEAPRDEPYAICEQFCEFFTVCRGDWQPAGLLTEPAVVTAADRYLEGQELEKRGARLKKEAKAMLKGSEGSTGTAIVRWVTVNGGRVESFMRKPGVRLDVRRVK